MNVLYTVFFPNWSYKSDKRHNKYLSILFPVFFSSEHQVVMPLVVNEMQFSLNFNKHFRFELNSFKNISYEAEQTQKAGNLDWMRWLTGKEMSKITANFENERIELRFWKAIHKINESKSQKITFGCTKHQSPPTHTFVPLIYIKYLINYGFTEMQTNEITQNSLNKKRSTLVFSQNDFLCTLMTEMST